ncbi:ribosome silencing factor [Ekhidna sp.]|uniref:ribosome silencing factor n=1 Tax=Ekhidna sp. TaxID=2608089 RepID=UPI0032995EBD
MNQQVSKDINSKELSEWVVEGMLDKKALDVVVMDLRKVKHAIADYFIICSGNSDTQIDAISDSIEEQIHKRSKQNPWKREGRQNKEWILLDYVDVVAHVFNKEKRTFYGLEELWGDAKITRIEEN